MLFAASKQAAQTRVPVLMRVFLTVSLTSVLDSDTSLN